MHTVGLVRFNEYIKVPERSDLNFIASLILAHFIHNAVTRTSAALVKNGRNDLIYNTLFGYRQLPEPT
jgi:hypothetical protein